MQRLRSSALIGLRSGVNTWWWIARITVYATLVVVLLQWSGAISYLSEILSPLFTLFGLSTEAVLVFITGSLANIYAAIGVIATLSLEFREVVILSVMLLICHNLIVETIIQKKSGSNGTAMVLLRVGTALVAAVGLNLILSDELSGRVIIVPTESIESMTLLGALESWGLSMAKMIPTMFVIICSLNIVQQILREFKLIDLISKPFAPMMNLLGLRKESSLIWLILNTLGLAYGGSIMIAERESGELGDRESKLLNTHIALSHSLLEDTLLFFAIGAPLFWLLVPRIVLAIVAVWVQRLYYKYQRRDGKYRAN